VAKRVSEDIRRYAVVGAEQRLLEIGREAQEIFRVFPELRGRERGFDGLRAGKSEAEATAQPSGTRKRRRRRRKMSAEARKRMSDAQKKRWAKKKTG
jgi:hypothetical protein